MTTQGLNLFIVDDNELLITDLKYYLQNKFGGSIKISTFIDGESCLEKIDKDTHVVILDHLLNGKNGLEVLKLIKEINPKTEVIMYSGSEDIGLAIETFRAGATDYVIKGQGALKKISKLVNYIITAPIRVLVNEFKVSKFMAIFLTTFLIMAAVVLYALYRMK